MVDRTFGSLGWGRGPDVSIVAALLCHAFAPCLRLSLPDDAAGRAPAIYGGLGAGDRRGPEQASAIGGTNCPGCPVNVLFAAQPHRGGPIAVARFWLDFNRLCWWAHKDSNLGPAD